MLPIIILMLGLALIYLFAVGNYLSNRAYAVPVPPFFVVYFLFLLLAHFIIRYEFIHKFFSFLPA